MPTVDAENSSTNQAGVFVAIPLDPLASCSTSNDTAESPFSGEIEETATSERNHRRKRVDGAATLYWIFVGVVACYVCMHFISYCYWKRQESSSASAPAPALFELTFSGPNGDAVFQSSATSGWTTVEVTRSPMEQVEKNAIELTSDTFHQFLSDNPTAMIYFYAPCFLFRYLYPKWQQFALKVQERQIPVAVGQVDCWSYRDLCPFTDRMSVFWFQNGVAQSPPVYHDSDFFTVDSLMEYVVSKFGQNNFLAR